MSPQLLTLKQLREQRDALTETELMRRCQDAARLELRGAQFSPDDRLDVAADIMLDVLVSTGGAPPNREDRRYSLTVLCGRAANCRRSIESRRKRDDTAATEEQDSNAWAIDGLTPDVSLPAEVTASEATHAAVEACKRLGLDDSRAPMLALFYGYARDLPGPVVAAELGLSPNAYDVACCRARTLIREQYPTATAFLKALIGESVPVVDPMTGETVLRYVQQDDSSPAHGRTHLLAKAWRDGTDNGDWPVRQSSESRREDVPLQEQADSLRRLGYALARS